MAPPLFALLLLVLVVAVIGAVILWGMRAGLWLKETRADATDGREDLEGLDRRPSHVRVEDDAGQRIVGS